MYNIVAIIIPIPIIVAVVVAAIILFVIVAYLGSPARHRVRRENDQEIYYNERTVNRILHDPEFNPVPLLHRLLELYLEYESPSEILKDVVLSRYVRTERKPRDIPKVPKIRTFWQ
jgi:hypothetical protein